MSYRINIFKRIITHINIQIQASNHTEITFQNFIKEAIDANVDERPEKNPEIIQCSGWKRQMQEAVQQDYPHLTPEEVTELADSKTNVLMLAVTV
jgi:kynurenine formamidase